MSEPLPTDAELEPVARAIVRARFNEKPDPGFENLAWPDWLNEARAAIEAWNHRAGAVTLSAEERADLQMAAAVLKAIEPESASRLRALAERLRKGSGA
jgi:hypothetical protein